MPAAKKPAMKTLKLLYIPQKDREGKRVEGQFYHSDAFGMAKVLSMFDMNKDKHDRPLRVAALNVRKKLVDANEAELEDIEVTKEEWDLLKRVADEPESHMKEKMVVGDKEIPMRDQVLQEMLVISALENLHLTMNGKPGLYPDDQPSEEGRPEDEQPV